MNYGNKMCSLCGNKICVMSLLHENWTSAFSIKFWGLTSSQWWMYKIFWSVFLSEKSIPFHMWFLLVQSYSQSAFTCSFHCFTCIPSHPFTCGSICSLIFSVTFHMWFPLVCSYSQSHPSYVHYIPLCLLSSFFVSSRWRQQVPRRHWYLRTRLHVEISQKTVTLIFIVCLFTYLMIYVGCPDT
jgi:hypothetical protein